MNIARILFGLAAAALALPLLATAAAAQVSREFRDWAASCDADLACRAETHHLDGDPADYRFRLTRLRDEATWNLVLEANVADPAQPFDIEADLAGPAISLRLKPDAAAYGRESDLYLLGEGANDLMAALGPASEITFSIRDEDGGSQPARFSLSGLSASLLWIDEKQGRIGSPREAGNAPEGVEPVGGAAALPEEVLVLHGRQEDCEAPEDLPDGDHHTAIALSDEVTLYLVPCYSGAYNYARAAYTGANGYFERLRFADYSTYTSWTVTDVIVNPEWDAASQRLSMFNRGRGLGDCGSIGEWRNHDGFLRLERFLYKGECDAEGEPGAFPVIFEAPPRDG